MNYFSSILRTGLPSLLNASTYLILCAFLAAGCTESLTGMEPDPEEPEPPTMTVYDLSVETHFIHITGSCDSTLGNPTQGEFQYRYEFTGGGLEYELESQDYNSRFGVVTGRVAGQQINFDDQKHSWTGLTATDGIEVRLFGTEWDGVIRDSRMSNRNGARTVPFKLGSSSRTITIGANSECQIYLSYTADWREREVRI